MKLIKQFRIAVGIFRKVISPLKGILLMVVILFGPARKTALELLVTIHPILN
jgi:hypothetical protein